MKNARTVAFGCYLVFRHADRALQRGQITPAGLAAVAKATRARVEPVWAQIFPGQEPAAYTWVLERLSFLESERVLTPDAAARMRAAAAPKASGADATNWGALALLWRVHVLYLLATDVADQAGLPESALARMREKLHQLALAALNREINSAAGQGAQTLHLVVESAREIARDILTKNEVDRSDGEVILAALGGAADLGEPAKVQTGEGTCLVCGEGFAKGPIVYCGACETPHHPDCWAYMGRCSMFACGCVDATPRPGATAKPRFDLRPAPEATGPAPVRASGDNPYAGLVIAAVILAAMMLASVLR